VIVPEIPSEYPWNVDLFSNSRKYFTPRLTFRTGTITFAELSLSGFTIERGFDNRKVGVA